MRPASARQPVSSLAVDGGNVQRSTGGTRKSSEPAQAVIIQTIVAITVTIAGEVKAPLLDSLVIEYSLNARTIANLTVFDEPGSYRPIIGEEVSVWDAATKIYGGSIDQVNKKLVRPNDAKIKHEILSVGFERWLDKRLTFNVETNTVPVWKSYSGTCNTDGVSISWASGDYFDTELLGRTILVDGTPRILSAISSPEWATLDSGAGVNSAIAWSYTWTAGAIVLDLIALYGSEEGISGSIREGSPVAGSIDLGANVTKLVGDYRIVSDVVDELAKLSGYITWIDADKVLHFAARETVAAPFDITNASKILDLSIRNTREDYRNMVALRASWKGFGVTPASFVGDGTARAWQLEQRAAAIDSMAVNDVQVSFGVAGVDVDKEFYFGVGERIVSQDPAGVVLGTSDTLSIDYRVLGSDVVVASARGSDIIARGVVENGTSGRYQVPVDDSQNSDPNDALAKAQSGVDRYKQMAQEIKYRTAEYLEPLAPLLRPGQLQTLNISRLGWSETWDEDTGTWDEDWSDWSATYLITKVRAVSAKALTVADEDGGNHRVLWYEVTAVTGTFLNNFLSTFETFVGGGGGSTGISAAGQAVPSLEYQAAYLGDGNRVIVPGAV